MNRNRSPRVALVVLLALASLLAACGQHEVAPSGKRYVALGDSYTAAPGIPGGLAVGQVPGCVQADRNYPHLVAQRLGLDLADVSCGAAKTAQMWDTQTIGEDTVPPQFDALNRDTDVVSVSLGGNDKYVFAHLTGACVYAAHTDPAGSPCIDQLGAHPAKTFATYGAGLTAKMTKVVQGIARRAPDAEILVVGYPQIAPEKGRCSELPLATGDYAFARDVVTMLNDAMRSAADAGGATYVDVASASQGHDICSDQPWMAGARPTQPGAPYHPYAVEQSAVADLVVKALNGSGS